MNDQKTYGHVTGEMLAKVKDVLKDADSHNFSISKIYSTHNAVFKMEEKGDSCASCLRKRADNLRKWLALYEGLNQTKEDRQEVPGVAGDTVYVDAFGEAHKTAQAAQAGSAAGNKAAVYIDTTGSQHDTAEAAQEASVNALYMGADGLVYVNVNAAKEAKQLLPEDEGMYADATEKEPSLYPNVPEGAARYTMAQGAPIDFKAYRAAAPNKGTVKYADGNTVKPGKYETSDGTKISVQVGSRATITE